MLSVAVVVLNYNGENLLQQFLPSVIQYSDNATIYVADNNSTDQSIHVLEKKFPSVKIIHHNENFGFCKGYNLALKGINADLFVLLNSDVEVTANWLEPIITLFENDHLIAAVQPKILSYRDKNKFEYAGAGGGFIDTLGYPFCRGRIFDTIEPDHGQYNDIKEVFWASGACCVVRADIYKKLGGLDEDFFAHMEEIDLCWRIHHNGHKVVYCGDATVYHLGAATLSHQHPRKTFLNFRNNLFMLLKNLRSDELWIKIPIRVMLDWLALLKFLISGRANHGWAVIKAHLAVIGSLSSTLKKRKSIHRSHTTPKTIYRGAIVYNYFIRNKQVYGELEGQ